MKVFLAVLLLCWLGADGASALSLQVAPVLLQVDAPGAATTVTLRNNGPKPITVQVRVFRWAQDAGQEHFDPTTDVVASPPAIELRPDQDYVLRVVRVTQRPIEREEAYRLFIDELPDTQPHPRTIDFVVRHAIPLFFDAQGHSAPELTWRMTQTGRGVTLTAINDGDGRVRLAAVRVRDVTGKLVSFGQGLVGYALGHSTMSWTARATKLVFKPGSSVSIDGQTENGPFKAKAEVQSVP